MPTDPAPLGNDGNPIQNFGFVMTLSGGSFSDGEPRRGRVIGIKPSGKRSDPDILVSFDIDGKEDIQKLKARDLRTAGSPLTWLGEELKARGDIGEVVAWKGKGGSRVGAIFGYPLGSKRNQTKFNAIDLDTGKTRLGLTPQNAWHVEESDLTPEQLATYERTELRGKEAGSSRRDLELGLNLSKAIRKEKTDEGLSNMEIESSDTRIQDASPGDDGRHHSVSGRNAKLLVKELGPEERVQAVVQHANPLMGNQALVATDDRLIVLKTGWGAGAFGGGRVSSFNWDDITGIQVNTGLINGTIVIQTPGMGATVPGDFFASGGNDPFKVPNVIPTDKTSLKRYKNDLDWIRERKRSGSRSGEEIFTPETSPVASTGNSKLDQLRQLGELWNDGILTEEEFNQMKREVIEGSSETPE